MNESPWITVALPVMALAVAVIWGALVSAPTLDNAQDDFERSTTRWPQSSDFETWRRRGELKCRDFKGLRTCEVLWLNEGMRDRMTFACSTEQCVWVDP